MAYDDPPTPARLPQPAQGQRCAGCGHLEADPWARFCGVCGATLGGGGPVASGPPDQTAYLPASPPDPTAYGAPLPPVQTYNAVPTGPTQPVVYTIPAVGLLSAARMGAVVAAAFTLLPCVLFAFVGAWLVHAGRQLLQSWLSANVRVPIPVVSVDLHLNFVELLQLRSVFDVLIYWDDRLWMTFALLWLAPWAVWIVAGAVFGIVLAAFYNLLGKTGGGFQVTAVPAAAPPARRASQTPAWPSGPPPGPPASWPLPPEHRR